MKAVRKISNSFFIESVLTGWGLCCLVYAFMFCSFFWGNHDWEYLQHGAELNSGFFEVRYSQHILSVLFFNGQFLPVMTVLCALLGLTAFAVFSGAYLYVPFNKAAYLGLILFIGLNPHIFVLFYYQHILLSFIYWPLICLAVMYWFEQKQIIWRFLVLVMALVGGFGSYPPFFTVIFCVFITRQLISYVENKKTLKEIIYLCLYFGLALIFALGIQKVIHLWLIRVGYVSPDMYNLQTRGLADIIKILPFELWMSVKQLFLQHAFMGNGYILTTVLMVFSAVLLILLKAKNKWMCGLFILACFLASRFTFIVASQTSGALFRIEYWGRLGLYIFALSILLKQDKRIIKNFVYLVLVCCLSVFAKADLEVQKVQALAFNAEAKYQQRIFERIVQHENFDIKKSYISFVFGLPNLRRHFYKDENETPNEILDYGMIFGFDFVNKLFESEGKSPIAVGMEIWEKRFFRAVRNNLPGDLYNSSDGIYIEPISYWLYNDARPYPNINAIYMDDRYIILVPDAKTFYQKREQFIQGIKDKGH